MSHSQFHCTGRAYLDMHGLIFETSICYWQDQPGRSASLAGPAGRLGTGPACLPSSEAETRGSERASGAHGGRNTHAGEERDENRGRRPPDGNDGNPRHTHTAAGSEQRTAGRGRTSGREEREEGDGWPGPGEATRREPPSRRETDALPRDAPRLLTTPRFQAGGRGRALESGCGAAAGPPHTRGSEAQRRGERDDPGPAPGGVGRPGTGRAGDGTPRQRAWRERRTAAAPGREAEAEETGTPRKNRAARVLANAGERREGGERDDDDDTRTVFPSRDVRGDAAAHDAQTGPDLGDGESHRPEPPPPAAPEEKKHASGGYLTARHPTRCGGGSPHETRLFPEHGDDDDGAGRVPRRTSAGGPTATPQTTDVR